MHPSNVVLDALERLSLTDIPDDALPQALATQAALLVQQDVDALGTYEPD